MTAARSQLVDATASGFYHCISRCVCRAFLCGEDALAGRSFEHRKQWMEDGLLALTEIFAVGVYANAVMSNHVHLLLYVDPGATLAGSADEIAERWVRLTPICIDGEIDPDACRAKAQALAGNPERIAILRQRLSSLSWFMKCLNEPIARRANREDTCTGHFWESRFKCQALLDYVAVLWLDGVYQEDIEQAQRKPRLHRARAPTSAQLTQLAGKIAHRVCRHLARQGLA